MSSPPLLCIVDDSVDYGSVLERLINHSFPAYSVCFFASGQVFLDRLPDLNSLPSLVLLDRHMPLLDGHQTLLRIKSHPAYKKIPVIMMSAEASAKEINGCYEAGCNSFLRKPLDFNLIKKQLDLLCQYWLEFNLHPVEGV